VTTPTLGGISLTKVTSIDPSKKANLLALPMPTGDSDETEIFDMLGVTKSINLSGDITESTIAAVKTIIDSLEALCDGDQENTVSFVSDQTGTISVKVVSVSTSWTIPGFTASFDIQLMQGV